MCAGHSLRELPVPAEMLGSENVVGTSSVVPWAHYEEWLSDLDIEAFWPEVGTACVNDNLKAPLLFGLCCH